MGDVIGDSNKRRGTIQSMDSSSTGLSYCKGRNALNLNLWVRYNSRTISSGRATSTMSMSHYAPVSAI